MSSKIMQRVKPSVAQRIAAQSSAQAIIEAQPVVGAVEREMQTRDFYSSSMELATEEDLAGNGDWKTDNIRNLHPECHEHFKAVAWQELEDMSVGADLEEEPPENDWGRGIVEPIPQRSRRTHPESTTVFECGPVNYTLTAA
jgi:hypothetical protein